MILRIIFSAIIFTGIRSATSNELLIPHPHPHTQSVFFNQAISTTDKFQRFSKNENNLLRISTFHFEPYMYQDNNGNFYNGIEYNLVKTIAKRLNMNLSFQTKHSNICDNVVVNISDICIGGLFPKENALEHTDISVTYASDDLTWCVQRALMMPLFLSQMFVLKPQTWLLIIFFYGYGSGLILYLLIQFDKKFEQRNIRDYIYTTWLVVLPAALGVSPLFNPKSGIVRSFYGFVLISGFMVFQIVFVYFYIFVTRDIPWRQISSFEEILEKDFHLAGSEEAFNVLNRSEKISTELFSICGRMNDCIERLLLDEKMAVAGSRRNILNSPSYSPSTVFCFDSESITSYPIALYMQKGFYLKQQVNDIILKLFEAGYFKKWDTGRVDNYKLLESPTEPLQVRHIGAVLVFLTGVATFMSVSTFIVESYVFWKMQQPVKHKIWIYLDQFFDGRRHYFKNVPERLQRQNKHYVPEVNYPYLE